MSANFPALGAGGSERRYASLGSAIVPDPFHIHRHDHETWDDAGMDQLAIIDQKLQRARFIAGQLAGVPFIRLMGLTNSVAMGTATELSDLDFFVVTAPNRLWTARFLLLIKAKWLGLTKRPGKTADQADFGWWIDETALNLSPIALPKLLTYEVRSSSTRSKHRTSQVRSSEQFDDPLLARLIATFIPLMDRGSVYERFMAANKLLANGERQIANSGRPEAIHHSLFTIHSLAERLLGSWFGEPIEWLLFILQRWKVWADPMTQHAAPLTVDDRRVDVVTTRHMLKLHHVDQRGRLRDAAIRSRTQAS